MGVEVYCRGRSNPTRGPKLGSGCIQTSPPADGPSADNSRLLRRLALNLAKLEGSRESLKSKLFRAALSEAFLTRLLAQFGKTQMR